MIALWTWWRWIRIDPDEIRRTELQGLLNRSKLRTFMHMDRFLKKSMAGHIKRAH